MRIIVISVALLAVCTGQTCTTVPSTGQGQDGTNGGGCTSGSGPHLESNGMVVVEAEHYTNTRPDSINILGVLVELNNRQWYEQAGSQNGPGPDPDGYHNGASCNAYLECLPDSRVTHDDTMETGAFYDGEGGAALDYEIIFHTPGTYYVWARAYSTGTEDNGLHVGIDRTIPASGMRMQWCGNGQWSWSNAQRDTGGSACGVNGTITINIPDAGLHTVTFHQREDGFEFDRFLLTTDSNYTPSGAGPMESLRRDP